MEMGALEAGAGSFCYLFGTAEFDPQRLELKIAGSHIEVQRKPLEILALLLANAGSIVTRERLLESVWHGRPIVDNVIASAITKLRTALSHETAISIVTHPRVGYRLSGSVHRVQSQPSASENIEFVPGMQLPHRSALTLVERLESGSCHDVWTVKHVSTEELRVYKFCRSAAGLSGLRREAALLHLLQQDLLEPSDVARVLDWNFETTPYFVGFEFAGVDLAAWANADDMLKSMSRTERLKVFLGIAQAVEAVHAVGVIHQDIKPSNILISLRSNGGVHVRLSDFGCGRLLPSDRLARFRITQFGLVSADALTACSSSGTPIYIAPELLTGQPASKQSDTYALGVLLYQFLVGDLQKPMAQGWERLIDDELLRADIAEATDCDLARRFSSVAQLCERLLHLDQRRVVRQQSLLAEHASSVARELDLRRSARRLWVFTTATLLAVAIVQSALIANARFNMKQASDPPACPLTPH